MSDLSLMGSIGVLVLASSMLAAELDEVNLRLLEQFDTPLRWDNIEGPPQWISGARLRFEPSHRLHVANLEPGQCVYLKIPPFSMLRVVTPTATLCLDDVEIWLSNGSGLYVQQAPAPTSNGDALLIAPDRAQAMVARIKRPDSSSCGVKVAFFVSRRHILDQVAPYRQLLRVCNPSVELRNEEHEVTDYFRVSPREPRKFFVEGPTRIAFETRMQYRLGESRLFQCYRVTTCLNGKVSKQLEYETSGEFRQRVWINGCVANVGRREIAHLNVPAGRHALTISATAIVYIRLLQLELPDYRSPHLNAPLVSAEQVLQQTLPLSDNSSLWDVTPEDIQRWTAAGPRFVAAQEQIALFSARNNEHRDGGMQGWMLMRRAAAHRPDYPPVHTVAEKIRGFHTHFRDLLPSDANADLAHRQAWFHVRRLRAPREPLRDVVLGRQHVNDALRQLASGHFLRIKADDKIVYRIPQNRGDTVLRIAVKRPTSATCQQFYVQFEHGPPMPIFAKKCSESPPDDFQITLTEAALSGLWHQHQKFGHGTLGGPFCTSRVPGDLIEASHGEIFLPAHVRQITVWADNSTNQELWVALQYRSSHPHRMSETEKLTLLSQIGVDASAMLGQLLSSSDQFVVRDKYAWREIWNDWRPLVRLLNHHARAFEGAIAKPVGAPEEVPIPVEELPKPVDVYSQANSSPDNRWSRFDELPLIQHVDAPSKKVSSAQHEVSSGPVEQRLREARQLSAEREWLAALEAWSALLPGVRGANRREALFARIHALREQGEPFLAELQLRGLFLRDEDRQVRQQAASRLRQLYRRGGRLYNLEQLAAVMVLREPTNENLAILADALLENGRYDFALSVALMVPKPQRPLETVLRAAVREGWWQAFDQHIRLLTDENERHYWQAVRCVCHGAYRVALDHYIKAGNRGQAYAQHLAWGFEIHRQLRSSDASARRATLSAWEDWVAEHPGPYLWQEDDSLVSNYCGAESVYSISRDLHAHYFKAKSERPLRLEVMGPARLKLEIRPLHDADSDEPIDDWIHLRTDGDSHTVPITENRPNLGLRVVGTELVAGQRLEPELSVGPGLQKIEILAESSELLVRVFLRRPEQPLAVLPPLTQSTRDTILAGKFTAMVQSGPKPMLLHLLPDNAVSKINVLPILHQTTVPGTLNQSTQHLPAETSPPSEEVYDGRLKDYTEPVAKRHTGADHQVTQVTASESSPSSRMRGGFAATENVKKINRFAANARFLHSPNLDGLGGLGSLRRLPPIADTRTSQIDVTPHGPRAGKLVTAVGWQTSFDQPIVRTFAIEPQQPAAFSRSVLDDSALAVDTDPSPNTGPAIQLANEPNRVEPQFIAPIPRPARQSTPHRAGVSGEHTEDPTVSIPSLQSAATDEQLVRRMREWLWLTEKEVASQDAYRVRGLALFADRPTDPNMGKLRRRLVRGTSWRLFSQIEGSAGVRMVDVPRSWSPESPSMRVRTALLSPFDAEDQLLVGNDRFVVAFQNTQPRLVDLSLRLESVPYVQAEPITVLVQVNDGETRQLTLSRQHPDRLVTVSAGSGAQKIAVWVDRPRTNQYVRVRANGRPHGAGPSIEGLPQSFVSPRERYYQVATQSEPLRFQLFGPAWLRIDELRGDTTYTRYMATSGGSETIDLRPTDGRKEALFRVFELVKTPTQENWQSPWVPIASAPVPPPVVPYTPTINVVDPSAGTAQAALAMTTPELSPPSVFLDDLYVLGGQEDATWSLASSWVRRRSLEGGSRGLAPDEFFQFELTRRYLPQWTDNYHKSDLLYRERRVAGSTLGLRHQFRYEPESGGWHLWMAGNAFVQEPDGAIAPATPHTEWSTTLRGRAVRYDQLTPKLGRLMSLSVFNRWLSLDENIYQPGRIDQDIFTPYKSQLRRGVTLSPALSYRPWLDTRWWIRGVLISHEDFDPTSPNSLGMRVGWSQFLAATEFDIAYRLTRYLEDRDRPNAFTRHLLYLNVVADCWRSPRHRYELGTQVLHDLGQGDTSVFVYLTWLFDNGRDYQDYSAIDSVFRGMRRFRGGRRPNNQLLLADG